VDALFSLQDQVVLVSGGVSAGIDWPIDLE